jgi:hypothetical protein
VVNRELEARYDHPTGRASRAEQSLGLGKLSEYGDSR